jgi:hypothetical protein
MRNVLGIESPSKVTAEIGRYVVEGFAVGLKDSRARNDMITAFKGMAEQFKKGLEDVNEEIRQAKDERKRLLESDNYTYKELNEVNKKIAKAQAEKKKLLNTRNYWRDSLDDERARLLKLASAYDIVTKKLEAAKDKLSNLRDEKKQYQEQLFSQYNTMPDIEKTTGLQGYLQQTKSATLANEEYRSSLDKLRKLGLDDDSYKKLLAEGPDAQSLVNQLAYGGKAAVSEFNKTNQALENSARTLAAGAAGKLYDAGIKAAEGLVKGLQAQEKNIQKEMDKIATYMVRQIKKGLGIKSPSREFMKIAKLSIDGLVQGFKQNKAAAGKAVGEISQETLAQWDYWIKKIREMAEKDMDTNPTIAPVIDLTAFRKGLKEMDGEAFPTASLTPEMSAKYAKIISAWNAKRAQEDYDAAQTAQTKQYIFNQTNNSPEPLSTIDIYRQSKTLMSQAKATG